MKPLLSLQYELRTRAPGFLAKAAPRFEVQENQELALKWFKRAVDLDPYCYEAVERLLGNHLLNAAQESPAGK